MYIKTVRISEKLLKVVKHRAKIEVLMNLLPYVN